MSDTEEKKQDELWGDPKEEVKDGEEELFEEEGLDGDEGKPKKEEVDQELKTEEQEKAEEKDPSLKTKARVRQREEERAEHERRLEEAENTVYKDEDFEKSMKLGFSDNKIDIDGTQKRLSEIAEEYPDVAALIKDMAGQIKKELGAPLESAQRFIDETRFWNVVEAKHPNARSMSTNKEFMDWVTADEDLDTLSSTGNPDDIVFILDLWKSKTTPKVDKAKEAKKNILKKEGGSSTGNRPDNTEDDDVVTPDLMKSIWG